MERNYNSIGIIYNKDYIENLNISNTIDPLKILQSP